MSERDDLMASVLVGLIRSVVVTDSVAVVIIFSVTVLIAARRLAGSSVIKKVAVEMLVCMLI